MRYVIYARKSSESEERQILSIEAQFAELQEYSAKEKLEIVASFQEAQTAKEPVKNVGSNLMLNSKRLEISPKNGWRARVADEPMTSFPNWRDTWVKYQPTPSTMRILWRVYSQSV